MSDDRLGPRDLRHHGGDPFRKPTLIVLFGSHQTHLITRNLGIATGWRGDLQNARSTDRANPVIIDIGILPRPFCGGGHGRTGNCDRGHPLLAADNVHQDCEFLGIVDHGRGRQRNDFRTDRVLKKTIEHIATGIAMGRVLVGKIGGAVLGHGPYRLMGLIGGKGHSR